MVFFLILIFGSILQCIYDIFAVNRLGEKCAKKAGYDCSKCENWKCFYYYCERKRKEKNNGF